MIQLQDNAWNRLVEVTDNRNVTIARYEYDGLNRRIVKDDELADPDVDYDYFYNTSWQIVEVRKDADTDPLIAMVYHTHYIDAPAYRNYDANTDGTSDEQYFSFDANFNVTALYDDSASVLERYEYDSYGQVTILDADFSTDGDGVSDYEQHHLFAGYRLDTESGLYEVRNRILHPTLGRWMQRDPLGYVDGGSLYEYVGSTPLFATDPLGLYQSVATVRECLENCKSGCPVSRRTIPMDPLPVTIDIPDPVCVARCRVLCGLCKPTCTPQGRVVWDLQPNKSGTGFSGGIWIEDEDPECCSEFAVIQFARKRQVGFGLPWSPWIIDDGRIGGSDKSPAAPFYDKPMPIRGPKGRGATRSFGDTPQSTFPVLWEYRIIVMCSAGPGAGHIYGMYRWTIGTQIRRKSWRPFHWERHIWHDPYGRSVPRHLVPHLLDDLPMIPAE